MLNGSYAQGYLSDESVHALRALPRHCEEIGRALGSDAPGADVLLVTILVDDSDSIGMITNGPGAEERGHDRLLEVLKRRGFTQALVHTRLLNGGTFSPYRPLAQAQTLSPNKLQLRRDGTPLYRESVLTLGSVIAKTQQQQEQGRRVRTVTLIITDGEDNTSGSVTAPDARCLVADMLEFASNHIVAGMGIGETGFTDVFQAMGIPSRFIFTAGSTAEEIDRMFDRFERTILEPAAASEGSFLQLAAGSSDD